MPPVYHKSAVNLARMLQAPKRQFFGQKQNLAVSIVETVFNADIDLTSAPPDFDLLPEITAEWMIKNSAVPWRRIGDLMIFATSEADNICLPESMPGDIKRVQISNAPRKQIVEEIGKYFSGELLDRAHTSCPESFSCRNFGKGWERYVAVLSIVAAIILLVTFPYLATTLLLVWALCSNLATTTLRLFALMSPGQSGELTKLPGNSIRISEHRKSPVVSILVPLYRENRVIPALIEALSSLSYPPELLDIKLLLEEKDVVTSKAITALTLPTFIEIITVPNDWLKTKPKAMNYALPFCRGEIVGIYDAEDRPESDQIEKLVKHLQNAPKEVACVQGYLDFYNSRQNWLSRCFTIEYAAWFRVIMSGLEGLNLPMPLGGTTVFFRRTVLEEIGAWDAHNVTEDADLGMRLARLGYRCEMLDSTTFEEANCTPVPWIKQRSRWIKGFAMTWVSHMRSPVRLYCDLGLKGFAAFHVLLLGGISAYLAVPLFWGMLCISLIGGWGLWEMLPQTFWWAYIAIMGLGQIIMFSVVVMAIADKERRHLFPYLFTLPLYWPLGALATYKAMAELFFAPFYWDKTEHGFAQED